MALEGQAASPNSKWRNWARLLASSVGLVLLLALAGVVALWWSDRDIREELKKCAIAHDVPSRLHAITRLGGREQALRRLRRYLTRPTWWAPYKATAVCVLTECGPDAEPVICGLLEHPSADVRFVVIEAIKKRKLPCSVRKVFSILANDENHKQARGNAAVILSRSGEDALPCLAEGLNHADVEVRLAVVWILTKIGGKRARLLLRKASADKDEGVRKAVHVAEQTRHVGGSVK
jgi:HEAT repeat protein